MSVRVQALVWQSDIGPVNKRMVLLALADNANDAGLCKPGIAYLVGKTGIPRSTMFRVLKALEDEELLQRRARRRENGSRRSNAYRINLELLAGRKRTITKSEEDELEALFDDEPPDSDQEEPTGQPHGPVPGPCTEEAEISPGQQHGPAAGPSEYIVPLRDGGGPAAGRAGGPAAGPLEPSVEPSGGGGGAHAASATAPGQESLFPNDPPPPIRRVDVHDRTSWLCEEHRSLEPGSERPACGKCARVREWAQARLAAQLRTAEEAAGAEAAARAEAARDCRWHDTAGWVLDPDTGLAMEPAVRCDHRSSPREIKNRISAHRRTPDSVASDETRRLALEEMARYTKRPTPPRPRRGNRSPSVIASGRSR
ncbi:hypothetical protein [Pseudonocardia spinosispora]|uniref:hypothetical protein n=1 Tax=Pseudonocardia spinosispora TaxID=103441 RepID=UPI0012EBE928|nr:hypothetical protein [Pseudonocardia spinosispora]